MADKISSNGLRLLRLGPSGSLTALLDKMGNYDLLLQDDLGGRCAFNVRFTPNGTFNGFVRVKPNFLVHEIAAPHPRLKYLYSFLSILRIIFKRDINLLHSNEPYMYGFLVCLAAKLTGRKCCVSIHSDFEKREALHRGAMPRVFGSLDWSRRIERWTYKLADRIFPIRESMRPHLLRQGCDPSKIRVFRHGMDLTPFTSPNTLDIRNHFGLPDDAVVVSSACRLVKDNFSDDLYAVAKKVTALDPKVHVLLCGDGPELSTLRSLVKKDRLEDRIHLPGAVASEVVAEMRKQSAVNLCLMGGFSLIEACASGRPTIAYDVEWHGELISDQSTGHLVAEGNTDEITRRVQQMIDAPEIATALGNKGRETATRLHSRDTVDAMKWELYQELMGFPANLEESTAHE